MKNHKLFRDKPDHLTKFQWRKLLRSMLTQPDPAYTWHQDKDGEWQRVRV